jgi:hypothetical protein
MMPPANTINIIAVLLLFLSFNPVFSQETDMENDTIQMDELVMVKNSKKLKVKTLVLDGSCYYSENMDKATEIITLADKLPEGTLQSVSFYFNDVLTRSSQSDKFRDNEFELILYTVSPDNTPGERIAHEPLTVKVGHKFSGRLIIDLAKLDITSAKKMFVGLKRLTPGAGKDEFFIDCLCNGVEYVTMVRKDAASAWERRWQCAALKVNVSVAVRK